MSVFEFQREKGTNPPRTGRRKSHFKNARTRTFKPFHVRVSVVMLQLFRQSFDSHDDDMYVCVYVFNNERVKVSEERR